MKVKLLSLNIDKNIPFARFQARVISSINAYTDESVNFDNFESIRELFGALQEALADDGIIITAVDTKHYSKLKAALSQALETEVEYNPTILNMLESNEELDDEKRKEFSSFPEPATVFLSKDGMYSGFGIENGSQYLILIPIDNDRINLILRNGVVPFLSKHIKTTQAESFLSETKLFDNEKVAVAVKRLLESNSVVAVNGTQNAEILKSCGDSVENFDEVFVFTPHVEDKGEVNATEYAAQLAKVSLDLSAANIGASISDIYTAGDTKYLCIAVADDETAVVRKLYMAENESEDVFIESAAVELIELTGEKAMGLRSVGIEVADAHVTPTETEPKKNSKKSMIILASILGVIVILCAVVGIVYKVQGENGSLARMMQSVFGYEENSTEAETSPSTTAGSEENTDKDVTVANRKISEFMVDDIISIEKLRKLEEDSAEEQTTGDGEQEPSTETAKDKNAPEFMYINGEKIEAKEALKRLVMTEMDVGYYDEAIKAQTVVIYTYLKYRDTDFTIDGVEILSSASAVNTQVSDAVDKVFGEYLVDEDGNVALTPYFEVAARKTFSGENFFARPHAYLKQVEIENDPDTNAEFNNGEYSKTVKIESGIMKGKLLSYNKDFVLSESDPSKWITVSKHDASISSSIGYVTEVLIGDKAYSISGYDFINEVLGEDTVKSHCFTVKYSNGVFEITSYGSGHGIGMSKVGAQYLASNGDNYKKILGKYFSGTKVVKEENV